MKATLQLDAENHRFIFTAPDFFLRFAIAPIITRVDSVLENKDGCLVLICNGDEAIIHLTEVTKQMGLKWDFSKYKTEVVL